MKTLLISIAALLLFMSGSTGAEPPADRGGKPETGQPGQGKPDQDTPGQNKPDQAKADKGKPDKIKPDQDPEVDHGLVRGGISVGTARELAREFQVTGQKPLPPGIRMNLERGKPMPPGIARTRLPEGLLGRLPAHPGYRWESVGTDLVLVQDGTGVVSEVLADVFD